jgi:hypothetical protein
MLAGPLACAQQYQKMPDGLRLNTDSLTVQVQFYTPEIVRILKFPKGREVTKQSLVVVLPPKPVALKINERDGVVAVSSRSTQVLVNKQTGQVCFETTQGQPLVSEQALDTRFTPKLDRKQATYQVRQQFQLTAGEAVYGLGQHQDGHLNYRGQQVTPKQANLAIAVPVLHSSRGYGLFWDNYSTTHFEDNATGASFDSEIGECVDYYVLNRQGSADGVVARYRQLTGQAPMFPRWTLGFWQTGRYELGGFLDWPALRGRPDGAAGHPHRRAAALCAGSRCYHWGRASSISARKKTPRWKSGCTLGPTATSRSMRTKTITTTTKKEPTPPPNCVGTTKPGG